MEPLLTAINLNPKTLMEPLLTAINLNPKPYGTQPLTTIPRKPSHISLLALRRLQAFASGASVQD